MAGNGSFHLSLLVGALVMFLPRTAPAVRPQRADTLDAAAPPNSQFAIDFLDSLVNREDPRAVSVEGMSDARVTEVLDTVCKLVDKDVLDGTTEYDIIQFLNNNIQDFATINRNLQPRPCLVHMLLHLMMRGQWFTTRQEARDALQHVRSTSPEAEEFLRQWEEAERRAARRLDDAANGRLTGDAEALALARRFYDGHVAVRQGTSNDIEKQRVVTLRREPMADLECAQTCVYATELATGASSGLFTGRIPFDFVGCKAYALLGGRRCVLFREPPKSDVQASGGSGRIRIYPIPAAVQFCMVAANFANQDTVAAKVAACRDDLTEQYSSAGAQQVTKLQNPTVVKHVCREECESLVLTIGNNRGSVFDHHSRQSWCSADIVQLVQAHQLQCCGDACGWDPASKTCAGIHLLSTVGQEEWFAECCSPSVVMQGSDRDHMCQSTSKIIWQVAVGPKRELQPGSLEAFKWGEDISPNFGETQTSKQAPQTANTFMPPAVVPHIKSAPTPGTPTGSTANGSTWAAKAPLPRVCHNIMVGSSSANTKLVPLPQAWLTCGAVPMGTLPPNTRASFAVDVSGSTLQVRRTDAPNGWHFALELACCATSRALVELGASRVASRVGQPASDAFQSLPCALRCADPTFMKSALLQCSAAASREWVALRQGVQSCPQAGLIKSEKTQSPADCTQLGTSTSGATHVSWQYVPGDKSEGKPHQGRCSLYRRCFQQDPNMFASSKSQMSNDTEVLWSRLVTGR